MQILYGIVQSKKNKFINIRKKFNNNLNISGQNQENF